MAKVTFRRGLASLYKERWNEYINNNVQDYKYLDNAIYFATDTHELYVNGLNYTMDEKELSDFVLSGMTSENVGKTAIQNGESVSDAFNKINESIVWNDEDDDN